jgi:photosystem II stability/assembly factor-like uncharacterized protein
MLTSDYRRWTAGIIAALLMMIPAPRAGAVRDERASTINLTGVPAPYSFSHFCRPNSDEMWVVGGDGTIVYRSSSGAVSEKRITDGALNGVYFVNSSTGWAVGEGGRILHTEDRGDHWAAQPGGLRDDLEAVTCVSERRCWAAGRGGVVLRTSDGGLHWEKTTASSADLFAVHFVNARLGWAVGAGGTIIHTRDGGKLWSAQRVDLVLFPEGPYAKPTNLLTVKFFDEKHGWLAGANGVARTTDGGQTWQSKEVEGTIIGLVPVNRTNVIAVTADGENYKTDDGGLTWTRYSSAPPPRNSCR